MEQIMSIKKLQDNLKMKSTSRNYHRSSRILEYCQNIIHRSYKSKYLRCFYLWMVLTLIVIFFQRQLSILCMPLLFLIVQLNVTQFIKSKKYTIFLDYETYEYVFSSLGGTSTDQHIHIYSYVFFQAPSSFRVWTKSREIRRKTKLLIKI